MSAGRPTDYSLEVASEICSRIANGQSVREVCRSDDMPVMSSVFKWLAERPEFSEQYILAKDAFSLYMAEELLDIADDGTNDWMERQRETKGIKWVENGEAINRSRLRVDTRKWLLSKLLPKKYGDKIVQEHGITNEFGEFLKRVAEQGRSIHGSEEKG